MTNVLHVRFTLYRPNAVTNCGPAGVNMTDGSPNNLPELAIADPTVTN